MPSAEQAKVIFTQACHYMSNPFEWHELTELPARFRPASDNELEYFCPVTEGNYFRIEIAGSEGYTGSGYDWVKVETVEDNRNPEYDRESFGMTLRTCSNPFRGSLANARFFKSLATSSFLVQRHGKLTTASYHGRNEVSASQAGNILDNMRNAFVAIGAEAGMTDAVWSRLLKAFLAKP